MFITANNNSRSSIKHYFIFFSGCINMLNFFNNGLYIRRKKRSDNLIS